MKHELKILPKYFEAVNCGKKNFEIRINDRNYQEDDELILKEWERGKYTGRECRRWVGYIYHGDGTYGIAENIVIMALKRSAPTVCLGNDTADRKTENSSEKPNNCDTCRNKGFEGCEQPCLGCGCCGLYEPKDEPTTQTETQNSNLTFEKDECAKEYEELGLKELKELIEADRKTEPNNSEIPNNCEVKNYCDDCLYTDTCDSKEFFYACTSKATISKMEQVDKDINVRSKDEPQTMLNDGTLVINVEDATKVGRVLVGDDKNRGDLYYPDDEDEPQTELVRVKYHCINCAENGSYKCSKCDGEMYYKYDKDEPQTERSSE